MGNVMLFDGCVGYSALLVQGGMYEGIYGKPVKSSVYGIRLGRTFI